MSPSLKAPHDANELQAREYIIECVREKCERIPYYLQPHKFTMKDFPDSLVTWGSASAYVVPLGGSPYRVLVEPKCIEVETGVWATPMDVVRYYLDYKIGRLPMKARGVTLDACRYPKRRPPLYARPWKGQAAHYDLKSAYWAIAQTVGWNVEYSPGKYLRAGLPLSDFPYWRHKVARNTLVSIGIQSSLRQYNTRTREYMVRKPGNKYKNVQLHALVMDVLNGVACHALAHGAVYVNTDGYIIPEAQRGHALETMGEWGLPVALDAEGDSQVYAIGSYRVAEKQTAKILSPMSICKVQSPVDPHWLMKRIAKLASRRELKIGRHMS